jgi:fatty acid desaturase
MTPGLAGARLDNVENGGARRRPREQYVSTFTELTAKIQQAGLMKRRYGFYWTSMSLAVVALAAIFTGVVLLGDSWFQLLLAAALAVVFSQLGFLGHEAAHRQIFRSARWNDWTGRVLATLLVGLSYGWWMNKHSRHHANPNREGKDPDIHNKAVAFTVRAADARTGVGAKLARVQGYFFLPLLLLEGLSLHVSSVRYLLTAPGAKQRTVEIVFLVLRLVGYLAVVFWLLPPGMAAAFLGVQLGVFGVLLGGAFAPNHIGMPVVAESVKFDFLRRQVLMSRNISGGPVVRFLMGGLENQVEHHLFPMMARPNLKKAQAIVREHCHQHGITYTEMSLVRSYKVILGYLNQVGLGARATFVCPLVQQYR